MSPSYNGCLPICHSPDPFNTYTAGPPSYLRRCPRSRCLARHRRMVGTRQAKSARSWKRRASLLPPDGDLDFLVESVERVWFVENERVWFKDHTCAVGGGNILKWKLKKVYYYSLQLYVVSDDEDEVWISYFFLCMTSLTTIHWMCVSYWHVTPKGDYSNGS